MQQQQQHNNSGGNGEGDGDGDGNSGDGQKEGAKAAGAVLSPPPLPPGSSPKADNANFVKSVIDGKGK